MKIKKWHIIAVKIITPIAFLIAIASWLGRPIVTSTPITYGATFSKRYATDLGLNWQEVYRAVLFDLKIPTIRLPVYWDEVEPRDGEYNFSDVDWQINEAKVAGAKIILALGRRVPRWPECFEPNWLNNQDESVKREKIKKLLVAEVNHFKQHKNIVIWQVENEPLFGLFGQCPPPDIKFLREEIATVKALDPRPVMVTDSGELQEWVRAAQVGDILGVTMYRQVGNQTLDNIYIRWPAFFYRIKLRLASVFAREIDLVEFQAEPWTSSTLDKEPIPKQLEKMNIERIKTLLYVARKSGLHDISFWGVEWWYWLKLRGVNDFWDFGKEIIRSQQ